MQPRLHDGRCSGRSKCGFTLIELLVVLGVVAVLLAFVLPALSSARAAARVSKSQANLRTIGQTFEMYEQEQGALPFGRAGWANPPWTGVNYSFAFYPWLIRSAWPVLMHEVAPWPEHARAWVSPGADDPNRFARTWTGNMSTFTTNLVSYHYSTSFIASPRLWSGLAEADEGLIRPQTFADVAFPSQKVLAFDAERPYLDHDRRQDDPRRPVLFADGSGAVRNDKDAARPIRNPLSPDEPKVYHDTPDGIGGRDF